MTNYKLNPSDFDDETASDSERAVEYWGDPDVNPDTGKDYDYED